MKKSLLAAVVLAVVSVTASAADTPVKPTKGKMLYAANGGRLASVYRVEDDGSVQLIMDGRMRTVPASTLSIADGKLTTSLSKPDIISR